MIATAVEKMVYELKTMPFTLLTVLALVAFSVYAYNTHASAGEIQELAAKVDSNTRSINQVLTLQIAEALRSLQVQLCLSKDHEAQRTLAATIEDLQVDYRQLTGSRYPLRDCD